MCILLPHCLNETTRRGQSGEDTGGDAVKKHEGCGWEGAGHEKHVLEDMFFVSGMRGASVIPDPAMQYYVVLYSTIAP